VNRLFFLILFFLLSEIIVPFVHANENGTFCVQLFKEMNQQIELGFVLPQTQQKIADFNYEREKGAMMVEFEFMNSIPMSARYEVFQEISQNKNIFEPETLKVLYLLLVPNSTTPLDHVAFQHRVGRYNKKSIEAHYQETYRKALVLISSAAAPLMTIKAIQDIQNKCNNSENQHLLKLCQFVTLPRQP